MTYCHILVRAALISNGAAPRPSPFFSTMHAGCFSRLCLSSQRYTEVEAATVVCKENSAEQMEEAWERGNLATAHYTLMTGHYAH